MAQNFKIDWASKVIISTSSSDAMATIPLEPMATFPTIKQGSWWIMGVAGNPAYVNVGAAATTSTILHPIGRDDTPKWIDPGTVYHALSFTGTGQVWFVRCYLMAV